MYDNVTIFVNSCDVREDAWAPFFKLLHDYWPAHPKKVVLNSETKEFHCDYMEVRNILPGKNVPWGKRFRQALESVDTDYIVYFLEDFFLMRDVSDESFQIALDKMESDPTIGCISLKYNEKLKYREGKSRQDTPFVSKDDLDTLNRVNNMSVLWRKVWLLQLVKDKETPWEFDRYATIRSRRYPCQVLMINCETGGMKPVFDYGVEFEYGYGIYKGKWLANNKKLFEKHGVEVDFEKIGWYVPDETGAKKERGGIGSLKDALYLLKKKIVRLIKTIENRYF